MRIFLLTFLVLISQVNDTFSQQEKKYNNMNPYKKNAIYGSIGIPIGYFLCNYERHIIRFSKDKIALKLSLSYGLFANLGSDGKAANICSDFVFGKSEHHFETDIGVAINHVHAYQGSSSGIPDKCPCIRICYRVQHNSNSFFFKTGFGYPEGAFACAGFAF